MSRKKWTSQDGTDIAVQKQRDKRKWQIAFRRYIMLESPCSYYAPYFGLDAANLRQWIELQFNTGQTWASFSTTWQFEHVVPVSVFNFDNEADIRLCWNFINIKVEPLEQGKKTSPAPDLLSARKYYEQLFSSTAYPLCQKMLHKIEALAKETSHDLKPQEAFIGKHLPYIHQLSQLGSFQYDQLNAGMPLEQVLHEMQLMAGH